MDELIGSLLAKEVSVTEGREVKRFVISTEVFCIVKTTCDPHALKSTKKSCAAAAANFAAQRVRETDIPVGGVVVEKTALARRSSGPIMLTSTHEMFTSADEAAVLNSSAANVSDCSVRLTR